MSPLRADGSTTAFVAGVLTPEGSLDVREPQTTLRLRYFPRLFWQKSAGSDARIRPLVLHQATLTFVTRPSATTSLSAQAAGSIGEPDYAALPQFLPTGQSVLPVVTNIVSISAGVAAQTDLSRRWQLSLSVSANHFGPLDSQTPQPPPVNATPGTLVVPISNATSATAIAGTAFQATTLDSLALTVAAVYGSYQVQAQTGAVPTAVTFFPVEILALNPMLTWRRRLAVATELRLGAGLGYATYLERAPVTGAAPAVIPSGAAELSTRSSSRATRAR